MKHLKSAYILLKGNANYAQITCENGASVVLKKILYV